MAKKHKAKGGGHQQKPNKRNSFKDKFSRESSGGPPSFSMRDEVRNTERHHSDWSASVRLRHQAMTFVSAGNMNPLEEAKIYEAEQKELEAEHRGTQDELDSDLEKSDGALAQMNIGSPTAASPPQPEPSVEMEVEETELSAFQTSGQETPSKDNSDASAQDPPQDLFVVDTVGDKSLAAQGPAPIFRDISPVNDDDSEEEIVVFRGRTSRVVVRDDPAIQQHKPSPQTVSVQQPSVEVAPTPKTTTMNELPKTAIATKDQAIRVPNVPTAKDLRASGLDANSALGASKAIRAGLKKQKRQSKKQKVNHHEDRLPRAAFGRIMDDPDMMEDDDEDALLEDYIANMSGGDELLAALHQNDSDWVSSVLDDDEQIEDEIEPTSTFAPTHGKSRSRKNKRVDSSSAPATDVDMTDASCIPSNVEDDEEDDDDDDDGTSDPGDDSELESDLEYTAQERWEDETDLRQRQMDALTDEEIARMLAKQEELGMGSDELLLLDDTGLGSGDFAEAEAGLEALLARPSARNKPKRGKNKQRSSFPSASLMADVLDQDPYGGFDIMDFDRPSLRPAGKKGRKSAGPMPEELADLSDEELIADLQSAWTSDRAKKAAKKAEREELRAEGMLGRGKANKFRADIQVKFAEGMSLTQLRREMEDFLDDDETQQKAFPPMEKKERKLLHEIANVFDLTSTSRGSGKNRFTLFSKRARTPEWDANRWGRVERIAQRGFLKGAGKGRAGKGERPQRAGRGGGFSQSAVSYQNGEVVGAAAPEIAEGNFGRRLMEKMGWEKGMALGKGGEGLLLPVEARVKSGRGGLG